VYVGEKMNIPPTEIDGAKVLEWAWSGEIPFGFIPSSASDQSIEVFGLAICRYPTSGKVYRFSCNSNWEVEQDADYDSVSEAKLKLPHQYREVEAIWIEFHPL
jgi:hypothetical protein